MDKVNLTPVEAIIKPLRPKGAGKRWLAWPVPPSVAAMGYPAERWYFYEQMIQVISAVEVATDPGQIDKGPEYHISISRLDGARPARVDSQTAKWVLKQFGLEGAEEDNHVQGGVVRNFWRTVAEPLIGLECPCKAEEPAIVEDKGDFVWRPL